MNFKTPEFLKKKITYFILGTPVALYLILTVFPMWFGCLIPKNYCLTGSTKFVDILTISAYMIPIILVIGAYNAWRTQKGAEVVAYESKQNIKDLLEIIKIVHLIINNNTTPDQCEEDFKAFKPLYESIVRNSLYINDCVEIDGFKEKMNDFFDHCLELLKMEYDFKRNFYNIKTRGKAELEIGYIGAIGIDLVNILIPYSTYQKEFIFKHKN
ncbi:hypothetical protein WH285_13750 [Acinetobacter johnsonii]|uniref:hypothetical protein n=1 Tax=Acinetobacter johnsonii TaxID=40214 RepID=UPI0030AF065B